MESDANSDARAGAPRKIALALEVLGVYLRVRWVLLRRGAVPAVSVLRQGLDGPAAPNSRQCEFSAVCASVAPS